MQNRFFLGLRAALALAVTLTTASVCAAGAETRVLPLRIAPEAGTVTPLEHWAIQSSAKAQQSGARVSSADFATREWYRVSGRATVMAGLIESGLYPDVFYSDNLRAIEIPDASGNRFVVPWWYRTQFALKKQARGAHTLLRTNGVIASADVWLNGHLVADCSVVAGAYPVHEFDVTRWVHEGTNTLALRVYPDDPQRALTIGWVDWNPPPPDANMGPWRGVDVIETGAVRLELPQVSSTLALPGLERADVTLKATLRNLEDAPHDVALAGEIAGVAVQRTVHLAANQTLTVAFTPATDAGLTLQQPNVWWPVGMGEHPLYRAELHATVDGTLSDRSATRFGIRTVTSRLTQQGHRQFVINDKPVLIRGAGWAPDLFLRENPQRLKAEFDYVLNLGLNAIRSEGKLENEHFYELADSLGVLLLSGWECCDKWEAWSETGGEPWDAQDRQVAINSMASEARLLHNHPSVIGFVIGSDNAPPPSIAQPYLDILRASDWPTPVVAAASRRITAEPGTSNGTPAVTEQPAAAGTGLAVADVFPSGMKMDGPYDWVPPIYWYSDKLGGAYGFDAEMSAGATIPRLADVQRMLSALEQEALWKYPSVRQYHAADSWSPFATLAVFDGALAKRYGAPKDLADYVAKAQLDNYDNVRAQFEAFNAHSDAVNPSTGVIYWMLNSAWPSLHWSLYDYYLNPAGAYFGAKKANEPVHVQYSYDSGAVRVVNHSVQDLRGLTVRMRLRNLDGSVLYDKTADALSLAAGAMSPPIALPVPSAISRTYFVELELHAAQGEPLSRNVYWLSTQPDRLDWANSNWYLTPLTQYADFTDLQSLPKAATEVRATTRREQGTAVTTVTLTNPASAKAVALFEHVALKRGEHGDFVVPILWSDNDVTLWPGESATLTARYAAPDGVAPVLEVDGWNLAPLHITLDTAKP